MHVRRVRGQSDAKTVCEIIARDAAQRDAEAQQPKWLTVVADEVAPPTPAACRPAPPPTPRSPPPPPPSQPPPLQPPTHPDTPLLPPLRLTPCASPQAHFMRNPVALWALLMAQLGTHSARSTIPGHRHALLHDA